MKSGARPKLSMKDSSWRVISAASTSGSSWRMRARPAIAASGRKAPSRSGLKLLLSGRIEHTERGRLRAVKARRDHHRRGGIEASAHDEIADRAADGGGNSEVIGAQPDAAALRPPGRGRV